MTTPHLLPKTVCLILFIALAQSSLGASVEFTIDPDRSQVTLSGTAAGLTVVEQAPGSLTTSLAGTLVTELQNHSISFPGGSLIDALLNGDWSPKALGEIGTEPADFGAAASGGFLSGTAALREVLLDLESPLPLPLDGQGFDADGLLFVFPEAAPTAFDFRISAFTIVNQDRRVLAGYATNQIATVGSLSTQGLTQTLTLPVNATIVFELLAPDDSTLTIQGQLVATRLLDVEPSVRITSTRLFQGELIFEWTPDPAATFAVEQTTNLATWTQVADVAGDVARWQVPVRAGMTFFRVIKQ